MKTNHGGPRPGAGRPPSGNERKNITIRLRDSERMALINEFGSVQRAIDSLIPAIPPPERTAD